MVDFTEGQQATCRSCALSIVWHFDLDPDALSWGEETPSRYGFWYDAEHMTEACGGPDGNGDPDDEDLWHEPL